MVATWATAVAAVFFAIATTVVVFRVVRGRLGYLLAPGFGLIVFLSSCSLYHHKFDVPPDQPNPSYDFFVVQSDDFGSFWDLDAAQAALDAVAARAATTNEIVVLFVHGWHHNADADNDENLRDFRLALAALQAELAKPTFRHGRKALTGDPDFRLVGIYVGWRGRSLPGLLDYGTMWWRKEAAERIGSGDIAEFLTRLQLTYERTNSFDPAAGADPRQHFMGLVAIGHSFGGQVLLKSVAPRLEQQLVAATSRLADTTPAALGPLEEREMKAPIRGLGDLNLLLNPALEAYQFARVDSLYRQRSYPRSQTPQLVVLSADNDRARKSFFPVARALTAPFRAKFRDEQQARQWSQALGELQDQRSHKLTLSEEPDTVDSSVYDGLDLEPLLALDFTNRVVFEGVALAPDTSKPRVPNSPVAVAYTYDRIVDGHNGIFNPKLRGFLGKYIAFIEGKTLAARFVDRTEKAERYQLERVSVPNR